MDVRFAWAVLCTGILLTAPAAATWSPTWVRSFASEQPLVGPFVAAAADSTGRFLVATWVNPDGGSGGSRLLLLGPDGTRIAETSPDSGPNVLVERIEACASGGWIFGGTGYSFAPQSRVLGRVDAMGRLAWTREIGSTDLELPYEAVFRFAATPDCGAVAHFASRASGAPVFAWLAALAPADGRPLWTRMLRPGVAPAPDFLPDAEVAVDAGGFHLAGRIRSTGELAVSRWSLAGGELTWLRGTGARAAGPDLTALALAGGRVFLAGLETAANAPPDAPQVSRVRAFAADSGAPAWDIVEPPDSGAGVPKLAARGARVVVSFGDAVALLNAGSGSLLWRVGAEAVRDVALADDGSVLARAVSPFVGSTAPPVSRLAAADGSVQWQVSGTQIGGMAYGWAVAPGASRLASLGSTDFVCCGAVRAQTLTLIDAATGAVASAPPLDAVRPQVPPRVLGLAQGGLVIATAEWTATAAQLRIMRVNEATGSAMWQTLVPVPMQPGALRLAVTALDVGPDGTIGVAGGAVGSGNLGSTVAVTLSPDDGIQIAHYVPPAGVVDGSTFVAWGVFNVWGDAGGNLLLRADRSSRAGSDLSYESLLRQLTPGGMAWERVTWPSEATTPLLVTAERVVVTERVGSGRVVSALSRASGVVQWSTPDIVWATSAAASPPGDRVHLLETITIAGTGDEEVRVRTLDLATGDFVWSRSLATGRLGFAGFSALAREAGGSLFVHFVRDGIRAWRLAGSDGQVEWQRDLPIEAGWRTGGGRMVQLGDGRIGYTLSRRMPSLAESTPLALGHLEVLDGSSGARLGTFATLGAQAPGAAGAIDPPVLATGLGVPVFTARRADPATGPVFEVASLPRPQRNAGDVTLELLAREPVAEDGTVERITVRLRYTGVVPNLALALRAGAASGVSIFAVACAGEAGATCGAADTAPALAVPVSLSDGGAATVAFTVAVPAWLDEPGQLYLGVEGDYRIDDADLANHTLQLPMRAVLLADSFE